MKTFFMFLLVIIITFRTGTLSPSEPVFNHNNFRFHFDEQMYLLHEMINAPDLNVEILKMALTGYHKLYKENRIDNENFLTIIDYSKSSEERRFFVIDIRQKKLVYKTLVSHGKNSGGNNAVTFSNIIHSNQSSLGFFITGESYYGDNGYSLRLDGVEKKINDNARKRAIVIHGADYVSDYFISEHGRLGRSYGCPALPVGLNREIIDCIKNRSCLFIYYPDEQYFKHSELINPTVTNINFHPKI